jgi:DNA-binding NtrC family response regulator
MALKLLLVLTPTRRSQLLPLLEGLDLEIEWAVGFQDAVRKLSGANCYDLLLVDAELPDGSWRNLLLFVQNSGMTSEMIVCSRLADQQLWAEVIQCGAYDLIAEPYERQEVSRIVGSALQSRYMQRFTRTMPARATAPG